MSRSPLAVPGAILALVLGCSATPPVESPPLFELSAVRYAGSALTGPLDASMGNEVEPEAWWARVDCEYVTQGAGDGGQDLAAIARHVFTPRDDLSSLSARIRVAYSLSASQVERSTAERCELGRELAGVEQALDAVLEILRSDAPRRREKRTRSTLREIADLRLDAVQRALDQGFNDATRPRIELKSPRARANPDLTSGRVVLELRQP